MVDNFGRKGSRYQQRAKRRKKAVRELDLSTVGLVFPIALLIGYFGGGWVGELFGRGALGSWIGLGLGLASGFYNLFKVALTLQRREQLESRGKDQPGDQGDDPHGAPALEDAEIRATGIPASASEAARSGVDEVKEESKAKTDVQRRSS